MKSFNTWLEDKESRSNGSRTIILNFLQDRLNIDDPETIMQMNTKDIDEDVIDDLMKRGIIRTTNQSIFQRIKNGITMQELVDLLAGDEDGSNMPTPSQASPPMVAPNIQPVQRSF